MKKLAASVVVAVLALSGLVYAQTRRSYDINEMRQLAIQNCQKIEQLKLFIVATINASHGLTETQKAVARIRFAPKPC